MAVPQVPEPFRAITHLGAPVQVFSPWRHAVVLLIAVPVGWLAAGGGFWWVMGKDGRPLPGGIWVPIGCFIFGLLIAVFLGARLLRRWGVAYQEGFAFGWGPEIKAYRWEDVAEVTSMARGREYYHSVQTTSGDTFAVLPGSLGRVISDETFPHRRERLAELFDRGETLDFGPLAISRAEGIRSGDDVFAWYEIKNMRIRGGALLVSKRDDTFWHAGGGYLGISLIPNLDVLLDLAREIGVDASRESLTELP